MRSCEESNRRLVEDFLPGTEDVFLTRRDPKQGLTQPAIKKHHLADVGVRIWRAQTGSGDS